MIELNAVSQVVHTLKMLDLFGYVHAQRAKERDRRILIENEERNHIIDEEGRDTHDKIAYEDEEEQEEQVHDDGWTTVKKTTDRNVNRRGGGLRDAPSRGGGRGRGKGFNRPPDDYREEWKDKDYEGKGRRGNRGNRFKPQYNRQDDNENRRYSRGDKINQP